MKNNVAIKCPEGARLIKLTQGKYAIVDEGDYELASKFKWFLCKPQNTSYARCKMYMGKMGGKEIYANMMLHNLIMRPPKGKEVDHKNHDGVNCRRSNMRIGTHKDNMRNRRPYKDTSSQFKGVAWAKANRKWVAMIKVNGKSINLGYYVSEVEAAHAYDHVAIKNYGEFAFTNFPRKVYA